MKFQVWHDNDFDLAHWVYLNTCLAVESNVEFRQIPKTNSAANIMSHMYGSEDLAILPAIKLETPDLVIVAVDDSGAGEAIFVAEFMTHTPQHDHPLQRYSRIYNAAQAGIESVLLIPRQKEKLERGRGNAYIPVMYRVNAFVQTLFKATESKFATETSLLFWPETNGYLKYDKQHPTCPRIEGDVSVLLGKLDAAIEKFKSGVPGKKLSQQNFNTRIEDYRLSTVRGYASKEYLSNDYPDRIPKSALKFDESIVYFPSGLNPNGNDFRTDPYAGKLCAFDTLFCRGDDGERVKNLILEAKNVLSTSRGRSQLEKKPHDHANCPFIAPSNKQRALIHFDGWCPFTERKQQRIFGSVADVVLFQDGEMYVS